MKRILDIALPLLVAALVIGGWEWAVAHWQVPVYVLPAPSAIVTAFLNNFASLMAALAATFLITIGGFLGAVAAALALAILFSQSRLIERSLYPYAVILQVTPVVAIAPLILLWIGYDRILWAETLIAGIVAFFPILSNTTQGLKSADFSPVTVLDRMGKKAIIPASSDKAKLIWSKPTQIRIRGAIATTGVTCRITA